MTKDAAPRKFRLFPRPLAQVVEPLTRPLFKSRGLAGTRIVADWAKIAGGGLAAHCLPEKLAFPRGKKTGGTLTVAVENGFATELQHLQPLIIERINAYYGYAAVTRLAISHSFPRRAPPPPKPAPAAAAQPEKMAAALAEIGDPELKKSLQSLANTLSGQ